MQQKDYIAPLCEVVYFIEDNIRTSGEAIFSTGDKEVDWLDNWNDRWG